MVDCTCVYVGGDKLDPTYHRIGDHTEGVHVRYDSDKISYEQLVEFFFQKASLHACSSSKQYQSGIWWHSDSQQKIVEKVISNIERRKGFTVSIHRGGITESGIYRAEEYHQRFFEKNPSSSW